MSTISSSARVSVAIATAGDEKYREILKGLVRSIRSHLQSVWMPIVVLDLGLGDETRAWLAGQGARCVVPDWDYKFDSHYPEYFKAMVSRPHLPKYLPEAETIIWLDADTWVQDWSAIDLLIRGAETKGFAIIAESDRSYTPIYNKSLYLNHLYDWFYQCFGEETAKALFPYSLINCGVFAAKATAPHWAAWASLLAESFGRTILFVSEQTALNVVLRTSGLPFSLLPATCNWICHRAQPLCTTDGGVLVTPELPHEVIGIVHLAGYSYERKLDPMVLATPDGGTVTRPLCYVPRN